MFVYVLEFFKRAWPWKCIDYYLNNSSNFLRIIILFWLGYYLLWFVKISLQSGFNFLSDRVLGFIATAILHLFFFELLSLQFLIHTGPYRLVTSWPSQLWEGQAYFSEVLMFSVPEGFKEISVFLTTSLGPLNGLSSSS